MRVKDKAPVVQRFSTSTDDPDLAKRDPAAMKRSTFALALLTVVASACGAAPAVASHSPLSTAPASAPAAAAAGPLACRLPVAGFVISAPKGMPDDSISADGQDNQKGTGGYLDLPSGKFTPAPDSDRSYLAGAHVWLPVSMQAVSPDQTSYVQGRATQVSNNAPTTSLYLVQVATRAERKLYTAPEGQLAFVLAFTSRGIYVETASSTGPGPTDMQLIDPATGAHRSVPGSQAPPGAMQQVFTALSGDFAWGTLIAGPQSQPSFKLVRLSLTDGAIAAWYDAPGPFYIAGFDSGHPLLGLVLAAPGATDASLYEITSANHATPIQAKSGTFMFGRGTSVSDGHGTWFGSADGSIWLYSSATGLEKVATVPPQPGATGQPYDQHAWRSVAGPCV